MLYFLILSASLAILAPLLGADSRDGLDWSPGHFWQRRPSARRSRPDPVRRTGSPARTSEGRAGADACRPAPAAW
jgi:hypothetical protein